MPPLKLVDPKAKVNADRVGGGQTGGLSAAEFPSSSIDDCLYGVRVLRPDNFIRDNEQPLPAERASLLGELKLAALISESTAFLLLT